MQKILNSIRSNPHGRGVQAGFRLILLSPVFKVVVSLVAGPYLQVLKETEADGYSLLYHFRGLLDCLDQQLEVKCQMSCTAAFVR